MRNSLKALARGLALVMVLPALASFFLRRVFLGADRALLGSSQALSLVPGALGQYVRTAFFRRALAQCEPSVVVEFGTVFSKAATRLESNVYIGPMCHIGLVHLEHDVLIGAGVHIPSGPETHGTSDLTRPIREQEGAIRLVRVGAGSWIGSAAIVLANVGPETVVGSGAVVTRELPERVVAAGVPAVVLRQRQQKG